MEKVYKIDKQMVWRSVAQLIPHLLVTIEERIGCILWWMTLDGGERCARKIQ